MTQENITFSGLTDIILIKTCNAAVKYLSTNLWSEDGKEIKTKGKKEK